jgi:hypothetical protein
VFGGKKQKNFVKHPFAQSQLSYDSFCTKGGEKNIYKLQKLKRLYETTNANGVTTFDCGLSENSCILKYSIYML